MHTPIISRRSLVRDGAIGAVTAVAALTLLAEEPRRSGAAMRAARSHGFNQRWLFGGRYARGAEQPGYDDAHFAPVTLPHTVTSLSWDGWNNRDWEHVWIYRKHFDGAAVSDGSRALLTFDGALTNATVVLNGTTVGSHIGGYLPWTTELTGHLKKGDNVLAVIVDGRWLDVPPDAKPAGPGTIDYLQPGGIYRDVTLHVVPEVCLADVFIRPVNVLSDGRAVKIGATIDAAVIPDGQTVTVTAALLDGARQLATATTAHRIGKTGTDAVRLTIGGIGGVDYWSPEHPKLYTVETTLTYPGNEHTIRTATGFREAVFRQDGFYLNGSRYKIFGVNRHQMFPYLGMAAPARLQKRDAEILKNELNCNMVRCSHYPPSPHFLDACDELGIMVFAEPPGWGYIGDAAFQRLVLANVRDMVVRDRNHPSIVVWGTRLDETRNYPSLYARAREIARQHDGSRQTAGAVTFRSLTGWAEDVYSYDDYRQIGGNPELFPPLPRVPYLVSESVGALDPTYRWLDPPAVLAHQAHAHALAHDQARSSPRYAGLLAWAGFDYYSYTSPGDIKGARIKNWNTLRTPGVVDTFRVPKPGAAIYQAQVSPAKRPVIVPVFCYDATAAPCGPEPDSMFATNCDRLEIYAGGIRLTTAYPDARRFRHLAYPPAFADLTLDDDTWPELRVDGYVGSALSITLRMSADASRDRLLLTADDTSITGNGSDATRITFRATDAYGNQRRKAAGDVTLSLTGPGTLVGSNPFPFGSYGGVGGAFIRSIPGKAGRVTVTARHATLGSAVVTVTVTPPRSASYL